MIDYFSLKSSQQMPIFGYRFALKSSIFGLESSQQMPIFGWRFSL